MTRAEGRVGGPSPGSVCVVFGALLLPITAAAADARAAEVSVGLGGGVSADLADPASTHAGVVHTRFVPGAVVTVPLRFRWRETFGLTIELGASFAGGQDRLLWSLPLGGRRVDVYDDDHRAWLSTFDLRVGPEIVFPVPGPVRPYVGVTAGVGLINVFHDLAGNDPGAAPGDLDADTAVLYDTSAYSYGTGALDPWTSQAAFIADARVGLRFRLGDRFDLWTEAGYGTAFVGAADLRKSDRALQARREAFAWNPVRGSFGFAVRL